MENARLKPASLNVGIVTANILNQIYLFAVNVIVFWNLNAHF